MNGKSFIAPNRWAPAFVLALLFSVTDFDELVRHPGLEEILREIFLIHAKGEGFIIFYLTHRFE